MLQLSPAGNLFNTSVDGSMICEYVLYTHVHALEVVTATQPIPKGSAST